MPRNNKAHSFDFRSLPPKVRRLAEAGFPDGQSIQISSDEDISPAVVDGSLVFVRGGSVGINGTMFARDQYIGMDRGLYAAWRNGGASNYLSVMVGDKVSYFFYDGTGQHGRFPGWYKHMPWADLPKDPDEGFVGWWVWMLLIVPALGAWTGFLLGLPVLTAGCGVTMVVFGHPIIWIPTLMMFAVLSGG